MELSVSPWWAENLQGQTLFVVRVHIPDMDSDQAGMAVEEIEIAVECVERG
jgi:hypothetical protein